MPYNLKRRRVPKINSSDSDSDIPFYKEQQSHVKKLKTNLETLCDADSPIQTDSDTSFGFLSRRSNVKPLNITNKDNDKHKKSHTVLEAKATSCLNESDGGNSIELNKSRRKQARNKVLSSIDTDDSSHDSIESLKRNQKEFISSSVKKRTRKSGTSEAVSCSQVIESESDLEIQNRKKKMSKSSSVKKPANEIDAIEIAEDECNENYNSDTGIIATTPIRSSKVPRKKQDALNYKPYVMKIIEESKNRFTRFKAQITNLQQRYLKDDVVNLNDANDIIFMLSCIISKLKEELTDHQHDLLDSHIEWSMQHNPKNIVPSMHHERSFNNNHLQVQSKRHNIFNNDDLICTANIYEKSPLQVTKIPTNNIELPNKHLESYKNHNRKDIESACKENNSFQINEDNVALQNNESILSIPDEVTRVNLNDKRRSSMDNTSNANNKSHSSKNRRWSDIPTIRRDFFKDILNIQTLLDESDAESTYSELNLYFSDVDSLQNKQVDATDARDKSQNYISENMLNTPDNNTRPKSACSISSKETVLLSKQLVSNNKICSSNIRKKKRFSSCLNNNNLIREPESRIVVPNVNNSNSKYRSKYTDKKLQMNCEVLINRCRV